MPTRLPAYASEYFSTEHGVMLSCPWGSGPGDAVSPIHIIPDGSSLSPSISSAVSSCDRAGAD